MIKSFDFDKITLTGGIFKSSRETGKKYLLKLNADRLLQPVCAAMGADTQAKAYGGWEQRDIAGHSLGHYLSALSEMYASDEAPDEELKKRIDYIVSRLGEMQDEKGFVGNFKRADMEKVFDGEFDVEPFSLNGIWVPWYSVHKIFSGLLDAYVYAKNEQAFDVLKRMCLWVSEGVNRMSPETAEKMLVCEHGGMLEIFARMYTLTGDERYWRTAEKFVHHAVMDALFDGRDELRGKHANTQLPKLIGAAHMYLSDKHEEKYRRAVDFFIDTVINTRSYALGGNSNFEHFSFPGNETLSTQTCETCNSYNMLKLLALQFKWEQSSECFKRYENILYNHILASQDPISGGKTYFMATVPGHFKVYSTPFDSFWCCVGTGMENPALYTRDIFMHDEDGVIYVNLFINSALKDEGLYIEQLTQYPYTPASEILITEGKNIRIAVRDDCFNFRINGEKAETEERNGYIYINKPLNAGDIVEWDIKAELKMHRSKSDYKKVYFKLGNILLAGDLGRKNFPPSDIVGDHTSLDRFPGIDVPVIVTDGAPLEHISRRDELVYAINGKIMSDGNDMYLVPYFDIHHRRYNIYWDTYTTAEYEEYKENEALQDAMVLIDEIRTGEQQPEIDHGLAHRNSSTHFWEPADKSCREAFGKDGFFEYTLTVPKSGNVVIEVDYWGADSSFTLDGTDMTREFTVSANDTQIAHITFDRPGGNDIYTEQYELTPDSSEKIRLKFAPAGENCATGRVFGIRTYLCETNPNKKIN